MAQLGNLLVTGSSRLLGKLFCNDISVGNSLSVKTLSATNFTATSITTSGLTVNGNATTTGTLNVGNSQANGKISINGKVSIRDYANNGWLGINDTLAWASGVYFGRTTVRTDGIFQVGDAGNKVLFNQSSAKFSVPVTINNSLAANNITATNVTVNDTLKAFRYELNTIQDLGGEFCVAPTIYIQSGAKVNVSKASATTITVSILDKTAITSDSIQGVRWAQNSKIKFQGKIDGLNIRCSGIMAAKLNTTANTMSLTLTVESAIANHFATAKNGASYSDISVMLYQRYGKKIGSTTENVYSPVGIRMSATGSTNAAPYIDIWGSKSNSDPDTVYTIPSVRLGYLDGLSTTLNGISISCNGYGLYADNVYLNGTIMSNSGTIGGFKIDYNSFTNGTWGTDKSVLVCTGTNTSKAVGGSSAISGWCFTAGSKFGVTTDGDLYASNANISGKITALDGYIGKYFITKTYLKTGTGSTCTGIGGDQAFWAGNDSSNSAPFRVSYAGALVSTNATITGSVTATSGTIGGCKIENGVLKVASANITSINADNITSGTLSADRLTSNNIVGTNGWINLKQGLFNYGNGTLVWDGSKLSVDGSVTATSGTIGGWKIDPTALYRTNDESLDDVYGVANCMYFGSNGLSISDTFSVDSKGAINAMKGQISNWTIGKKALYKTSDSTITEDTAYGIKNCYYFGSNGLSISDTFSVDSKGAINATSGSIGRWNIYQQDNTFRSGAFYSRCVKKNEWNAAVYICPPDLSKFDNDESTSPFILTRYADSSNSITTFRLDQYGNIMSRGWDGKNSPVGNNILRITNAKLKITTNSNQILFDQNIIGGNNLETYSNYMRTNYFCITSNSSFNYLAKYKGFYCDQNAYFQNDIYHNNNILGSTSVSTPNAMSIATATWSNTGAYITLPVGKYLLVGTVAFTSNKAGRVGVRITEGGNIVPQATTLIPGLSGSSANLTVQVQWIFNVTENTTYRLQAFQTSGGNLSVTGYFKSVCLS